VLFKDCYRLKLNETQWQRLEDIPVAVSHAEYSTFAVGDRVFVLGGFVADHNATDLIQVYDTVKDQWTIVGRMPWRNKGLVADYADGYLYVALGQKGVSRFNAAFGDVIKGGFRARIDLNENSFIASMSGNFTKGRDLGL
jgi:DNA-binding beta-propeller fold protein YncE